MPALALAVFVAVGAIAVAPIPVATGGGAAGIVLGSKTYERGTPAMWHWLGWGTARPHTISNGGDPGGVVFNIHWHDWGKPVATAYGQTSIYLASSGWYWGAWIELRADVVGKCPNSRSAAYLHLQVREPHHPHGRLGRWFEWGGGPPMSSSTCGLGRHR